MSKYIVTVAVGKGSPVGERNAATLIGSPGVVCSIIISDTSDSGNAAQQIMA
jgi:hypothetical protein